MHINKTMIQVVWKIDGFITSHLIGQLFSDAGRKMRISEIRNPNLHLLIPQ